MKPTPPELQERAPEPAPARPSCLTPVLLLAILVFLLVREWPRSVGPLLDPGARPHAVTARGDLAADELATIELFEANLRSVVHIGTRARERRRYFSRDLLGTGSGFVWDANGYVVTNYHVLAGVQRVIVTLADGERYEGHFVGGDPTFDLAVLKINAPPSALEPVLIGSSADLRVGQKVFAIGNPYGLDRTLTTGVISGLDRVITSVGKSPIAGVVQTDAAINPGNSGGPLLDSAGRLIGINTAIYSETGDSAGIGFAVPVDTINEVVPVLISSGVRERPALGIYPAGEAFARRFGITGAVIGGVAAGSGAERAGLRPLRELPEGGYELDVFVAIDGTPVRRWTDLVLILADKKVGDEVEVELRRDGERALVTVRLQGVR